MKTIRRLQTLAVLLLSICLSVSGQSTDYSNVAFVGKVLDVRLVEKGGVQNSISVSANSGDLQNHMVLTGPPLSNYLVTCMVEKLFYSHYPEDTIVFLTYAESEPIMSYCKYVFCLLKQNNAGKYETFRQYYDAYQTKKGEWVAGFYSGWMLDSDFFSENSKKVVVNKKQYLDMQYFKGKSFNNKRGFSVYYKIKGEKAIPKVGVPVDVLMKHLLVKKIF